MDSSHPSTIPELAHAAVLREAYPKGYGGGDAESEII